MIEQYLKKIETVNTADLVIQQLREMIEKGVLKPGDKLPPERVLVEKFMVGRGFVREALKKLEFYGIVETRPQSGTYVANLGIRLIDHLIANVIQLDQENLDALIETRKILEVNAVRLAAGRITEAQLDSLADTLALFEQQVKAGASGMEADMLFHIQIAGFTGNSLLRNLISLITPQISQLSDKYKLCADDRPAQALEEHRQIYEAIKRRDSEAAAEAMEVHLANTTLKR